MTNRKLNIVLLTAGSYSSSGGLNYDIFKSLTLFGHNVLLLTRDYDIYREPGIEFVNGKWMTLFRKLLFKVLFKRKKRKLNPSYYMFGIFEKWYYQPTKKILSHFKSKPDAIIYIFPHLFLNSKNLYELYTATQAPIFIMPMDTAQITGGCHFNNNCERYIYNCGKCPGISSNKENDNTYKNILFKKHYLNKTKTYTLGNLWMSEIMKKSSLYKSSPNFNLNIPINEQIFHLLNKAEAKNHFSIPPNKKIIFFGAASVEEKRKGLTYLIDALNQLYNEISQEERETICVAFAGHTKSPLQNLIPFQSYSLGQLSARKELPYAYQMADVFISPSTQEGGSMMIIQSMMCGTPVVAFEMGNAFDFIDDGRTGYKVPLYNIADLKDKIYKVLTMSEDHISLMAQDCRKKAIEKSSYSAFAKNLDTILTDIVK